MQIVGSGAQAQIGRETREPPGKGDTETVTHRATIAMLIAAALASGGASATKTVGEATTKVYEKRAESEYRKSWCRWG